MDAPHFSQTMLSPFSPGGGCPGPGKRLQTDLVSTPDPVKTGLYRTAFPVGLLSGPIATVIIMVEGKGFGRRGCTARVTSS